ncbi:MAG: hypothetical protein RL557_72 [archaeon]|jgi:hypothetical protein
MNWFGKKEEKELLPDLPEPEVEHLPALPELPDLPEKFEAEVSGGKDSFDDFYSSTEMPLNQQIKETVSPKKSQKQFDMSGFRKSDEVLHEPAPEPVKPTEFKKQKGDAIYIKLDKFQATQEAFYDIQNKVNDIEKLLTKLKEVKAKEDKELETWERETQMIKSRLEVIDSHLFEKI